jgi:outer membrane protein OmpA-like peptidoglycan-associated protein
MTPTACWTPPITARSTKDLPPTPAAQTRIATTTPGKPELQGCKEKQLVRIQESSIDILEVVQFEYNKAAIQKRSFKLLDEVSKVIVNHPELKHLRVEGHTDDRGNDAYNKKLSQARAESVMRYLTEHGVAAERLVAVGYGEEKPVADNTTENGRTKNRRVEFKIIDASAATKPAEIQWALELEQRVKTENYQPSSEEKKRYDDIARSLDKGNSSPSRPVDSNGPPSKASPRP